jgi:hypothetical protein
MNMFLSFGFHVSAAIVVLGGLENPGLPGPVSFRIY